jgi:hypothetical protein
MRGLCEGDISEGVHVGTVTDISEGVSGWGGWL